MTRARAAQRLGCSFAACVLAAACGEPLVDRAAPPPPRKPDPPPCAVGEDVFAECERWLVGLGGGATISPRSIAPSVCTAPSGGAVVQPSPPQGAAVQPSPPQDACAPPPPGAPWRDVEVRLHADVPREVELRGVDVVDARVHLVGPVTLRLRELTVLRRLTVTADSSAARLRFEHVDTFGVTVGDVAAPFPGRVEAQHTSFADLSLSVAALELDGVVVEASFIAADTLDAADGVFRGSTLEVGDGLFAPSYWHGVVLQRCRSLSLFGGEIQSSTVARCDGEVPTRVYNVGVETSVLDGLVTIEGGRVVESLLGLFAPSEHVLWYADVRESVFCDQARSLRSSGGVRCSYCSEGAFGAPSDTCRLELPEPDGDAGVEPDASAPERVNICAALDEQTLCEAPLPVRERAHRARRRSR